jgi:hypothetical protein
MKMIDKIKEYIGEAQASQHRTLNYFDSFWNRVLKRVFAEFKNVPNEKDLDK